MRTRLAFGAPPSSTKPWGPTKEHAMCAVTEECTVAGSDRASASQVRLRWSMGVFIVQSSPTIASAWLGTEPQTIELSTESLLILASYAQESNTAAHFPVDVCLASPRRPLRTSGSVQLSDTEGLSDVEAEAPTGPSAGERGGLAGVWQRARALVASRDAESLRDWCDARDREVSGRTGLHANTALGPSHAWPCLTCARAQGDRPKGRSRCSAASGMAS